MQTLGGGGGGGLKGDMRRGVSEWLTVGCGEAAWVAAPSAGRAVRPPQPAHQRWLHPGGRREGGGRAAPKTINPKPYPTAPKQPHVLANDTVRPLLSVSRPSSSTPSSTFITSAWAFSTSSNSTTE